MNSKQALEALDDFVNQEYPVYLERIQNLDSLKQALGIYQQLSQIQFPDYFKEFDTLGTSKMDELHSLLERRVQEQIKDFKHEDMDEAASYYTLQQQYPNLKYNKRILNEGKYAYNLNSILESFNDYVNEVLENDHPNSQAYQKQVEKYGRELENLQDPKNAFYQNAIRLFEEKKDYADRILKTKDRIKEDLKQIKYAIQHENYSFVPTKYEVDDKYLQKDIRLYNKKVEQYYKKKRDYEVQLERKQKENQLRDNHQKRLDIMLLKEENRQLESHRAEAEKKSNEYRIRDEQLTETLKNNTQDEDREYSLAEHLNTTPEPSTYRLLKLKDILQGKNGKHDMYDRLQQFADYLSTMKDVRKAEDKKFLEHLQDGLLKAVKNGELGRFTPKSTYKKAIVNDALNLCKKYLAA